VNKMSKRRKKHFNPFYGLHPDHVAGFVNSVHVSAQGGKLSISSGINPFISNPAPSDMHVEIDGKTYVGYGPGSTSVFSSARMDIWGGAGGCGTSSCDCGCDEPLESRVVNVCKKPKKQKVIQSIEKDYELHAGSVINYRAKEGSLDIRFNNTAHTVKVRGEGFKPKYKNGVLNLRQFNGHLSLPRTLDIIFDIKTKNGNVTGEIAQPGKIKTEYGNISLELHRLLKVIAKQDYGAPYIPEMIKTNEGFYLPRGEHSDLASLKVATEKGVIHIRYFAPVNP